MSFIDDKLLNSNFLNEPLNHLAYIQSLENKGENSFLFDDHSKDQLNDLLLNSQSVWAHREFYDLFMKKLTDDQIKMLIKEHKNIGDIMNSLFGGTTYSTGGFNDVCEYMNETGIQKMPVRFLKSFKSIITEIIESPNVLTWINDRYGVDLSSYETLESAIKNTEGWKLMIANSSLMSVICITDWFTKKVIESDFKQIWVTTDGLTYYDNNGVQYNKTTNQPTGITIETSTLEDIKTSNLVTEDHIEVRDSAYKRLREALTWFIQNESLQIISDHDDLMDILITSDDACQYLADNPTTTLKAALENYRFAKKIFTSNLMFEKIGSNQEALQVIVNFIADIQKSYDRLAEIKPNLLVVSENTGDIYNATALMSQIKPIVNEINTVMTDINNCQNYTILTKENINGLIHNASAIMNAFSNLTFVKMVGDNAEFSKQVVNNADVATYVSEHTDSYNVLLSGEAFLDALINDNGGFYESHWISTTEKREFILKNKTAMTKIGENEDLTRRFLNKHLNYEDSSFSDYNTNMASTVYIGSVTNDKLAMDFVGNDKLCADTVVDSKDFMDAICRSDYFTSFETDTIYDAISRHGDIGFMKYMLKKLNSKAVFETFTAFVKSITGNRSDSTQLQLQPLFGTFISNFPDLFLKIFTSNDFLIKIYFNPDNLFTSQSDRWSNTDNDINYVRVWSWLKIFDPVKESILNDNFFIGNLIYFLTNMNGKMNYYYLAYDGSQPVTDITLTPQTWGITKNTMSDYTNDDFKKFELFAKSAFNYTNINKSLAGTCFEPLKEVKDYLYNSDIFMRRRLSYLMNNKCDLNQYESVEALVNDKTFITSMISNSDCFGVAMASKVFVDAIKSKKEILDLFYKNYNQVQTIMNTACNKDLHSTKTLFYTYIKTSDLLIHKTWHVDDDNESENVFTSTDYELIDNRRCLVVSITNNGSGNYYGLTIEGSGENAIPNGSTEVPILMFVKQLKIKAPGSIKAIDYIPID